jgi:endonuclease/exonuclease/phosphatase family metal-dependent hydrolase
MIKNCEDKIIWRFISVYDSPYEEGKSDFIQELNSLMENWDGPTLIGGDFNLIVDKSEKSNGVVNQKWVDLFNDWIHNFGLLELKNSSRSYTWTNNQDLPIMAAIDKLLCNNKFEQIFPRAFVTAKARARSDHVPLILNSGLQETKKPSI